jgi:stage II sporulation protein P
MNKRGLIYVAAAVVLLTLLLQGSRSLVTTQPVVEFFESLQMDEISRQDLAEGRFWTMVDEAGHEIMVTGRRIYPGDEYLTADNKLYRVHRVSGRTAYARFIREVGLIFDTQKPGIFVMLRQQLGWPAMPVQNQENEGLEPSQRPKQLIGIYHTHNAESYVPSDGTDSINGKGGIHDVGTSFTHALEAQGVTVIHDETLHLPHDRGAYRRSRVTTERLLAEGPDVIFDVHRDAAPKQAYALQVEDEWVTQIQFVVGRQNPNMTVTRQFALDLKNNADEIHPGLVRGIFMAHGNYNQDLTPLNLLLEVGAHQNSRDAAEDGIALFADVVTFYFYGPEGERAAPAPPPGVAPPGARTAVGGQAAFTGIFRLLGITAAIILGFILLNIGRWQDIKPLLAKRLRGLLLWFARGDRLLAPWQEKVENAAAPGLEKVKMALAPPLRMIRHWLARGDQYLAPFQERLEAAGAPLVRVVRQWFARGDRLLAVWQQRLEEAGEIIFRVVRLWIEQGDCYLALWQQRIEPAVAPRLRMLPSWISRGDRYLEPWEKRFAQLGPATVSWLSRADRVLEDWQEKIREFSLMIKAKLSDLFNRVRGRDKLR